VLQPICSICHHAYVGYGHNAWPVLDGFCCDECHHWLVVPARLALMVLERRSQGGTEGR
jgi:hypothetical protein